MSEVIRATRDEMEEALITYTLSHCEENPDYIELMLIHGFKGYIRFTDAELIKEYREYISEDDNAKVEIILEESGHEAI